MKYTVQAAARATGVTEHRLRTWERRYGVPTPARSATGRRLYNDDDLVVIRLMARLVEAGIPASEAAAAALDGARETAPSAPPAPRHPAIDLMLGWARAFDAASLENELRAALLRDGHAAALNNVVLPFLHDLGREWESAQLTVACEHFASEIVRRVLYSSSPVGQQQDPDAPTLVLACPSGEQHDLGALALWLLLQPEPINVIYLGSDVPTQELLATCELLRPEAVCLIATIGTAVPGMWLTARRVVEARIPTRVFVGGAAIAREATPEIAMGDRLPASIADAAIWLVEQVTATAARNGHPEKLPR